MPSGGGGQTSTTTTSYPAQYNQLLDQVASKAQDVANLPLQQYQEDQVADLAPDTLAAFNLARQSIGSTDAINNSALGALNNYGNYSGLDTGIQSLDAMGNPQNYSNLNTVSPLVSNALPALNSSAAGYTQSLLNSSGANATLPSIIQNYLNPYTNDVVNQIATLGQKNLVQNILPSINKTFVGGGAFGGSRNNEFMSRAVADTNNDILGQQTTALNNQYNSAASQAQADLDRLTGQAQNLGSQYGSDLSRTISGTTDLSNLLTNAGTSDADRRTAAAQYLQGLGSTDAANQLTYGQNLQNYGTNIYNQNLKDASVLEGIGQTQQQQEQNEINAQMAQFNQAANYPQQQLATLESPLQTINIPKTETTTSSGSSDPFGDILGTLVSGAGIAAKAGAFAHGGSIPRSPLMRYADGGAVDSNDYNRLLDALKSSAAGRGMVDTRFQRSDNSMSPSEIARAAAHEKLDQEWEQRMEDNEAKKDNPKYATDGLIQGYDEGGSVLDDLLKKIFQNNDLATPQDWGSDSKSQGSSLTDAISALPEGHDDTDFPAIYQAPKPDIAPQQQSPLIAPPQRAMPISASAPNVPQSIASNQQSPLVDGDITWNGPRVDPRSQTIQALANNPNDVDRAAILKNGLSDADMARKKAADLESGKWSSAAIDAGAGMLLKPGTFFSKLGAGLSAGNKSLDENQTQQLGAYQKLADIDGRNADWKQQVALLRATNGQNAVGNKDADKRADLAQKQLDSLPPNDPRRPAYQKIVDEYVQGASGGTPGGGVLPGANIAKTVAQPGTIVSGYRFKGGDPKDPNNWEKQ